MNFDQLRYTLRANFFTWLGRDEQALAAFVECFKANPRNAEAARSVAWLHARNKRWPAAAQWFERALALEPDHADTWFNLGYVQHQAGHAEAALEAFGKAVAGNPKLDRAWYGMGMVQAGRGDHAAAAESLRRAAELQPMNGAAWYALGMAEYHCSRPEAVKAVIEHCIRHDPQTARRLVQDAQRPDLAHLLPN
ncbi:MAG: tetratricopeptide repeat protein [Pseudomonadota bacterium]